MHLLHFTSSLTLSGGGVTTCLHGLAHSQVPISHHVSILTYEDLKSDDASFVWNEIHIKTVKRYRMGGVPIGSDALNEINQIQPDVIHVHGLWLRLSDYARQWSKQHDKPYVISPHGMLDPWAVKNAAWKKKIAGHLYEYAGLKSSSCLHALCEEEAQAFRKFGLKNPIAIIPNGIHLPEPDVLSSTTAPWHGIPEAQGKKVLLFIGRIHPKKGLSLLLDALAELKKTHRQLLAEWVVMIAGYDQVNHVSELRTQIAELNLEKQVFFVGTVTGKLKVAALQQADAFCLPSYSEGLPMSVLEAWAYGLPVLMTPECNLKEGFAAGAAIHIETRAGSVADGLIGLFQMTDIQRKSMGMNGKQLVAEKFTWTAVAKQTMDLYQWLLGEADKPLSVIDR